jgi:biopolymer transport protein TolR
MSFAIGSTGGPKAEMNVTPLIDVLLVLLIISMIVSPISRGELTDVPQQQAKTIPEDTAVVLQVMQSKEGLPTLAINRQQLAWADLRDRLIAIYKFRADRVLFIKGDADVEFEHVARVIDTAHSADVRRVGLIP